MTTTDTTIYCTIVNDKVETVFCCPQDPSDKPGYAEIPDTDPRWLAHINPPNAAIDAQIAALEATMTPRRVREATVTDAGKAWLVGLDAQIAALRAQRR